MVLAFDLPSSRARPCPRHRLRSQLPRPFPATQTPWRRLHQADQDAHRPDRVLRGGQRYLGCRRPEEGRAHRPEVGDLLRSADYPGAGDRPGVRLHQRHRQRRQHPPGPAVQRRRQQPGRAWPAYPRCHGILHGPDPHLGDRRLCRQQHPPGAAVLGTVRQRAEPGGRLGSRHLAADQRTEPRDLPHHGHDRASGAVRRVRRRRLHHQQIWPGFAAAPGQPGWPVLPDLRGVCDIDSRPGDAPLWPENVAIARWEKDIDLERAHNVLDGKPGFAPTPRKQPNPHQQEF